MIRKDLNRVLAPFEIMPLLFEGPHDRQHFLVMGLIIKLSWFQLLAIEGHRVPFSLLA
jgi:hypothetical protein